MFLNKQDLKFLLRSNSWRFMRAARFGNTGPMETCEWKGHTLHYRPGTSDPHLIYKILLRTGEKAEYVFPPKLQARVIFDIGANIGAASLLLAERFAQARIFSFEPVPDNFALLERNLAKAANVTPVQLALSGDADGRELIFSPDKFNQGGFSFYQDGAPKDVARIRVPTATPAGFMRERGLEGVDLIKIDTEGAEYEILTAFDREVLSRVKWIIGELHGQRDFELLAYLAQWFDISVKKSFRKPLFVFAACNKHALGEILG